MRTATVLRPAILSAAAVLQAALLFAQVPAPRVKPDSSRIAAARRVLVANGSAELMVTMIKANIPTQRAAMPDVPAEFWDRFEARVVTDAPQLVDSIAVLYASTFTEDELNQLAAFYESPIGQRLRGAQRDLLLEGTAIGQRWGARIGAEIGASLSPEGGR